MIGIDATPDDQQQTSPDIVFDVLSVGTQSRFLTVIMTATRWKMTCATHRQKQKWICGMKPASSTMSLNVEERHSEDEHAEGDGHDNSYVSIYIYIYKCNMVLESS